VIRQSWTSLVPAVVAYESAAIKGASFRDALAQMADAAENGKRVDARPDR